MSERVGPDFKPQPQVGTGSLQEGKDGYRNKDTRRWWLCELRPSRPDDKPLPNITYKNIETFQTANNKKTEKAHKSLFCFTLN